MISVPNFLNKPIVRFALIGGVGFIVDASVLIALHSRMDLSLLLARFFSFGLAVFVTWQLNRVFTFQVDDSVAAGIGTEYIRYYVIQFVGAGINFAGFSYLVYGFGLLEERPVIALGIMAVIVMVFNYLCLKIFVYKVKSSGSV